MRTLQQVHQGAVDVAKGDGLLDTEWQTADYRIGIGFHTQKDEEDRYLTYVIVNKITGVIELSGASLPNVILNMHNFQNHLVAIRTDLHKLVIDPTILEDSGTKN